MLDILKCWVIAILHPQLRIHFGYTEILTMASGVSSHPFEIMTALCLVWLLWVTKQHPINGVGETGT